MTLDIVMPDDNGLEVLKKLRAVDSRARIVIVSGLHQDALLQEAMARGASSYVVKPFTAEALLGALRTEPTAENAGGKE